MRRRTAAPKPIKMTAARLDPDGLRQAYEWMTVDRAASLRLALAWYGANFTTLLRGDPLDADRQKSYDRGVKSAAIGDHTTFAGEREASWTMALRMYEKTWPNRNLPSVMEAMQAADIGGQPTRRVSDIGTVIGMLNGAYAGAATFRMTFGAEREFDGEHLLIPVAELTAMVPLTPLKIALRELPTVAKALSVTHDSDTGGKSLDGAKFMEVLPTLLDKVSDWAAGNNYASKPVGKAAAMRPSMARTSSIKHAASATPKADRLPPAGSTIRHNWKGRTLCVEVLANGFRYEGVEYKSLSRIACVVTGYKTCNGFDFFKLNK